MYYHVLVVRQVAGVSSDLSLTRARCRPMLAVFYVASVHLAGAGGEGSLGVGTGRGFLGGDIDDRLKSLLHGWSCAALHWLKGEQIKALKCFS